MKPKFLPVSPAVLSSLLLGTTLATAGIDDLRITEVDPAGDSVEVTHFSQTSFTTDAPLPFSHRLNNGSHIPAGTEFGPRESKVFTVSGLNNSSSDIWLYRDGSLASPDSILTGISFGEGNLGRNEVAVAAGIWPSAETFVPAPASGQSLRLTGYDSSDPGLWMSLPPQPGEFFTTVTNPFPPLPPNPEAIGLQLVASGLTAPLGVVDPDDGSGRLFIFEQHGFIRILRGGEVEPTPFLDIEARTLSENPGYDERGLIGFALDPDFASNGRIYTHSSEAADGVPDFPITANSINHHGVIAEWTVDPTDPDRIDPASRREILRLDSPQSNHNGGELLFGPDGMLYIALGDGGGANDNRSGHGETGNGQNPLTVLGSVLRIDPRGDNSANGRYGIPADNPFVGDPGKLDEIWAYGFRNPFRMSLDPPTGRIFVADVGQGEIEEINLLEKGGNYGWRTKEGSFFFNQSNGDISADIPFEPVPPGVIDPVAQYDHSEGISIIGGYVYRGSLLPTFKGKYLFGDFGTSFDEPSGRLFCMDAAGELTSLALGLNPRPFGRWVKGLGRDAAGEIYLCGSTELAPTGSGGSVWRLIPLIRILSFEREPGDMLRITVVGDEDSGTVSLRGGDELPGFPSLLPLSPLDHSLFEAVVPIDRSRRFFQAALEP